MTYIIMEAEKLNIVSKLETQENWCVVPGWVQKPEHQNWWSMFQFKSWQSWDPKRANVQSEAKRYKRQHPSSKSQTRGVSCCLVFLFYADLQLMGWGSSTLGRAICCNQSVASNVNPIQKHPLWQAHNNVFPNIWE